MTKFCLFLFLTLLALQGHNSASLNEGSLKAEEGGLEDAMKIINELTDRVSKINADISTGLSLIIQNLLLEIDQSTLTHSIVSVIADIENTITSMGANAGQPGEACIETSLNTAIQLGQTSQGAHDTCTSEARLTATTLQDWIQLVLAKGNAIMVQIAEHFQYCVNSSGAHVEGIVQCVEKMTEPVKKKLDDLEKEVKLNLTNGEKKVDDAIDKLNECLDKVVEDAKSKGKGIIEDMKSCLEKGKLLYE